MANRTNTPRKASRSHKTKKRLAIKHARLAKKAPKKTSKRKKTSKK
ncbi:MAG: hypothetical protein WCQ60_03160 [bacterium]